MEFFWTYIFSASLYLLFFGATYLLLFSRKINPVFNRFYILSTTALSMLLPLLSFINIEVGNAGQEMATLPEVVIEAGMNYHVATSTFINNLNSLELLHWTFYSISSLLFLRLLWQIGNILLLVVKNEHEKLAGMTLVKTKNDDLPFSFFHWIFIGKELIHQAEFPSVLTHEKAHYQKVHSFDILLFSFVRIVFWFHPAIYFMESELRSMHEFEADAIALKTHEKITYQKNLLSLNYAGLLIPITNPFNVTLIKKRLLMMNEKKWQKPAHNWLKLAAAVPVLALAVMVQSCHFNKEEQETEPAKELIKSLEVTSEGAMVETLVDPMTEYADAEPDSDSLYMVVQDMPIFPGGTEAMMQFIASNIKYPEKAKKDGIQGRVFVNFIVEADGRVTNAKVLRGIGGGCDEEAVRVVGMMPAWTPGKQHGKPVRVSFNLPVKFVLNQ